MADLEQFARRMQGYADRIPRNVSVTASEAALRVLSIVIPATPVDTGRARGNWQTSLDRPISRESGVLDKTGQTMITAAKTTLAGKPPGRDIYIVNNVPYIKLLNQGSSRQAPANFVETAIQIALAGVRNAKVVR